MLEAVDGPAATGILPVRLLVESSEIEIWFASFTLYCWLLTRFLDQQDQLLAIFLAVLECLSEDAVLLDFFLVYV